MHFQCIFAKGKEVFPSYLPGAKLIVEIFIKTVNEKFRTPRPRDINQKGLSTKCLSFLIKVGLSNN